MKRSEMLSLVMKQAHKIKARFVNFGAALKAAWAWFKNGMKEVNIFSAESFLLENGGKKWEKAGMSRIYMTCSLLNALLEKIGRIGGYSLNDTKNKIYFENGNVYRRYKDGKPNLEVKLA